MALVAESALVVARCEPKPVPSISPISMAIAAAPSGWSGVSAVACRSALTCDAGSRLGGSRARCWLELRTNRPTAVVTGKSLEDLLTAWMDAIRGLGMRFQPVGTPNTNRPVFGPGAGRTAK